MCGRYLLDLPGHTLAAMLDAAAGADGIGPSWNAAPTMELPVLSWDRAAARRVLEPATWGLVPGWARRSNAPSKPLINARAETITEKASFRTAFRRRRVLVPATGFYEWQKLDGGGKQPHVIRVRDLAVDLASGTPLEHVAEPGEPAMPFLMAGIAEVWVDTDGVPELTYAVVTTSPNPLCAPIHDRMPVILQGDDAQAWLEAPEDEADGLLGLLRPYPEEAMECWPVGRDVGNARTDHPGLTAPLLLP